MWGLLTDKWISFALHYCKFCVVSGYCICVSVHCISPIVCCLSESCLFVIIEYRYHDSLIIVIKRRICSFYFWHQFASSYIYDIVVSDMYNELTQPSTLHGIVTWVSAFRLNACGGCRHHSCLFRRTSRSRCKSWWPPSTVLNSSNIARGFCLDLGFATPNALPWPWATSLGLVARCVVFYNGCRYIFCRRQQVCNLWTKMIPLLSACQQISFLGI